MSEALVLTERADGVELITLNRPNALNAWTPELARELLAAVRAAAEDDRVRCVLLTGAGRAFSAGADVKNPRELTPEGDIDLSTRLRTIYNPIVLALREMRKPAVAAVNGPAVGIGLSLALACDLIVAAESAYFLLAFVNLGVIPDGGAPGGLAARVGTARAAQLMMLGERLPAPTALAWGLINEVVADGEALTRGRELAERLAGGPTVALGNMKRALRTSAELPLAEQLELEATIQQEHATTADYAEGVQAFKEKRKPRFEGR